MAANIKLDVSDASDVMVDIFQLKYRSMKYINNFSGMFRAYQHFESKPLHGRLSIIIIIPTTHARIQTLN
jgi:hypothetical protein